MESQSLINALLGIACGLIGWLGREIWATVKDLQEDVSKISIDLPKNYVIRADFREDLKSLKEMQAKLFDKLEQKQEKAK